MKINKIFIFILLCSYLFSDFTYKDLPIQQSGRIKPLDTFARNHLLQFYGKSNIKENQSENIEAIDWLYLILLNPEEEMERPIFNIRNPEVSFSLGLEKNYKHKYSF